MITAIESMAFVVPVDWTGKKRLIYPNEDYLVSVHIDEAEAMDQEPGPLCRGPLFQKISRTALCPEESARLSCVLYAFRSDLYPE